MAKRPNNSLQVKSYAHVNEILSQMYLASSSCHGASETLPNVELVGYVEYFETHEIHGALRKRVTNDMNRSILERKLDWSVWVCIYSTDNEEDICTEMTYLTFNKMTCGDIQEVVNDTIFKMISESTECENFTGYGWCAAPSIDFDFESQENTIHDHFIKCGVLDPERSFITFTRKEVA